MLLWVILQLKFFKVGKWIGAREPWIHGILENGVVGLVLLISKFPYQIHVYCFQNITQHREYDWYILIELNNRIITVIEAMVTFKPHKNKENEIEHYVYQSVNQTLGTFSQLFFFFPTPANCLELLVNEMFFLLWYKIKEKFTFSFLH